MERAAAGIRSLRLETADLEAAERFYGATLGLPAAIDSGRLVVRAGNTQLVFVPATSGRPFYHFAFNVPENQIAQAFRWVESRTPVARPPGGGEAIYDFESWNAHAFYFLDPAGNLAEFIARHSLPNAATEAFSERSILGVSEIGWVVDDVPLAIGKLEGALGLTPYRPPMPDFGAVGDENALVIVTKRGRVWLGSNGLAAAPFPFEAEIAAVRPGTLSEPPVRIVASP